MSFLPLPLPPPPHTGATANPAAAFAQAERADALVHDQETWTSKDQVLLTTKSFILEIDGTMIPKNIIFLSSRLSREMLYLLRRELSLVGDSSRAQAANVEALRVGDGKHGDRVRFQRCRLMDESLFFSAQTTAEMNDSRTMKGAIQPRTMFSAECLLACRGKRERPAIVTRRDREDVQGQPDAPVVVNAENIHEGNTKHNRLEHRTSLQPTKSHQQPWGTSHQVAIPCFDANVHTLHITLGTPLGKSESIKWRRMKWRNATRDVGTILSTP